MRASLAFARGALLRPRSFLGGLMAVLLLSLPGSAVFAVVARGSAESGVMVSAAEAAAFVLAKGSLAGLVAALVSALAVGGEYRHRTIVRAVLAQPRRGTYYGAELVVAAALAVPYAVVGAGSALLVGSAITGGLVTGSLPVGTTLALGLGAVASGVLWSWIGVGLAHLCRAQPAPVAVLVVGWMVVEPMARGLLARGGPTGRFVSGLSPLVGSEALVRIGSGDEAALFAEAAAPLPAAVAAFCLVVAMVVALGGWRLRHRLVL